ncbi:MAG: hypothetical protein AB7O96_11795 [Pseudobdellovibrionaceae bacterium]
MKWLYLIPLFFTVTARADLAPYGYLRVRVVGGVNAEHNHAAQLLANNQPIGTPFCHSNRLDCEGRSAPRDSNTPYPWIPLESVHINFSARSTPASALYKFRDFCEFDFEVDYSLDQQQVITFKPFRAPHATGLASIPIGGGCNSRVMRVCSSDPQLQKKLEAQYRAALVNNYNAWKSDYDNRLMNRIKQSEEIAKQAAQDLRRQKVDFERGHEILESSIEKWKLETEAARERARQSEKVSDESENADDLGNKIADQAEEAAIAERLAANEPPGGYQSFWLSRQMDQTHINETLKGSGDFTARDAREFEMAQRHTEFFQNAFVKGEAVWTVVGNMVKLGSTIAPGAKSVSYLSKTSKLCKVFTGREFCFGTEVSLEEKVKAICELGRPFSKTQEIALEKVDPKAAEYLKKLINSGICKKISDAFK